MSVIVKTNMKPFQEIIKEHGLEKNGNVTKFLRDEVDRLCDPYVPMNTGILKNTKTYPNNYSIKYVSNYAQYLYYGKLMLAKNGSSWAKHGEKKYLTKKSLKYQGAPKRGAKWDKRMINDKKQQIVNDLQNYIKRGV